MKLLTPLYDVNAIINTGALILDKTNLTGFNIMQRAAQSAFDVMRNKWPKAQNIAIVVGNDDNTSNGYFLARLCISAGLDVEIYYLTAPQTLINEVKEAYLSAKEMNVIIKPFTSNCLEKADIIVDAIMGIGIDRSLSGIWLGAIMAINRAHAKVLSLDIPTGLNANTGALYTDAVKADVTVTFLAMKPGLLTGYGLEKAGEVILADLHFPSEYFDSVRPKAYLFNVNLITEWLAPRRISTHKGDYGHVLIIGGQPGMGGSVLLAGEAALRTGAGLVSIATHSSHASVAMLYRPELMVHGIGKPEKLDALIAAASCIVIGCGLGTDEWGYDLLKIALSSQKTLIIDADGLNIISKSPELDLLIRENKNIVVTPHPLEASRLLGLSLNAVESDRLKAASLLADKFPIAVLKGSGSIVVDQDIISINTTGNPGMASAGMGDVLSGIIAGLYVQGLSLRRATRVGVWLHGTAGDIAADNCGEHSMIASDVILALKGVLRDNYR